MLELAALMRSMRYCDGDLVEGASFRPNLRQRGSLMTTRNSPEPADCCGLPGPADGVLLEFALPGLFANIVPPATRYL